MNRARIKKWMKDNKNRFIDPYTGEINMTEMVETWDNECASGEDTYDEDHIAWEIAAELDS